MTWQFLVCQSNSARVSARSWYCETERDGLLLWSSTRLPGQCLTTCIRRILLQAAMIVFQKFDSASPVSLHRQAAISSYWRFTFFLFLMMPHHILKHKHKHILHVLHVHMDTCTPIYHWCIWKWISPHMAIEISKPLDFGIPYFQTNPHTHRHTCNTCNTYNTCMRAFRYATQAQACSCTRAHTHTHADANRDIRTDTNWHITIQCNHRYKQMQTYTLTYAHAQKDVLTYVSIHTHRIAAACSHIQSLFGVLLKSYGWVRPRAPTPNQPLWPEHSLHRQPRPGPFWQDMNLLNQRSTMSCGTLSTFDHMRRRWPKPALEELLTAGNVPGSWESHHRSSQIDMGELNAVAMEITWNQCDQFDQCAGQKDSGRDDRNAPRSLEPPTASSNKWPRNSEQSWLVWY